MCIFSEKKPVKRIEKKKKKQKISSTTIVKIKTKLSVVNCLSFGHICVHIFYLLQIEKISQRLYNGAPPKKYPTHPILKKKEFFYRQDITIIIIEIKNVNF